MKLKLFKNFKLIKGCFMNKFEQFLAVNKIEFYVNFSLSQISSIKLGAKVKLAVFPKTESELEMIILKL